MNMFIESAKAPHTCHLPTCTQDIQPGEVLIATRVGGELLRYHIDCWTTFCKAYAAQPLPRGRHRLPIDSDVRRHRERLLRHYSTIRRRMEAAESAGKLALVTKYVIQLAGIQMEVADLGGLPRSWEADTMIRHTVHLLTEAEEALRSQRSA